MLFASCTGGGDADLSYRIGRNALAQGRAIEAREAFASVRDEQPGRSGVLLQLSTAWVMEPHPRLAPAAEALAAYLEARPDDEQASLRLAKVLYLDGDWEGAAEHLARAGSSLDAEVFRAKALSALEPLDAYNAAREALQRFPEAPELHAAAAGVAKAAGLEAEALAHARRAAELGSRQPEDYFLLAGLERKAGHAPEAKRAIEIYQLMTALGDDESTTPTEALAQARTLARLFGKAPVWLRVAEARLLFRVGSATEAVSRVQALRAEAALSIRERMRLAALAAASARSGLARDLYQDVLDPAPAHRGALNGMAELALARADYEAVARIAEDGLAAEPWLAAYHHLLGLAAMGQGETDAAIESLRQALALAPWQATWRLSLARLLLAESRHDELASIMQAAPFETAALASFKRQHGR